VEIRPNSTHLDITLGAGTDAVSFDGFVADGGSVDIKDFSAEDGLLLRGFFSSHDPVGDGLIRVAQRGADAVVQVNFGGPETVWHDLAALDGVQAAGLTTKQLDGFRPGPTWLLGGKGHDDLASTGSLTHLDGAGGADALTGSSKADVLAGGSGADVLTGGGGADVFLYQAASDSTVTEHDLITDLTGADIIDLSAVDANIDWFGDQAFVLVDHFSGAGGELIVSYRSGPDATLIMGDTNGDGAADFEIMVRGDHHAFTNFVL
jgi:Ca2+-binding RTX toxin-like protein